MEMLHNKAMSNALGLNMNGSAINFAVLLRAFHAANLRWEVHPAQLFSVELHSTFLDPETIQEVSTEVSEGETELLNREIKHTLMGIPITLREDYPNTWIRLYAGDKLIAYLENLSVPWAWRPND
jgi:hypothetical protein